MTSAVSTYTRMVADAQAPPCLSACDEPRPPRKSATPSASPPPPHLVPHCVTTSVDIEDQTEDFADFCERRHADVPSCGFDSIDRHRPDVLTLCGGI
jgi:hypothetical protein